MTLKQDGYRERLIDPTIDKHLQSFGAVCIQGPKGAGKTWAAENHADSEFDTTGRTGPLDNRDILASDIRKALVGDSPHLIDEWQEFPVFGTLSATTSMPAPGNGGTSSQDLGCRPVILTSTAGPGAYLI